MGVIEKSEQYMGVALRKVERFIKALGLRESTMSTFNLQQGVESNERSEPAPDSFILCVPRKSLVKPLQSVLYRKEGTTL